MPAPQFTTVLPHEPLPGPGPGHGYVHLQGAFVPRRKAAGPSPPGGDNDGPSSANGEGCPCHDANYIEATLRRSLQDVLPRWNMDPDALVSIAAVRDPPNTPPNEGTPNAPKGVSKVRLALASHAAARTLTSRVRRAQYSPRDAFASQNGVVVNEGLCPHGCGARYSGKEVQATHIAPMDDRTTATSGATSDGHSNEHEVEEAEAARWARAAPPKFRRLQATDATSSSSKNRLTEEEVERRRKTARFVYVGNVLANVAVGDVALLCGEDGRTGGEEASQEASREAMAWKERLVSIFRGRAWDGDDVGGGADAVDEVDRGMVEDDVRHAFHEAVRMAIRREGLASDPRGVELFTKSDRSGGKGKQAKARKQPRANHVAGTRNLYDGLHIGTRSNADAARVIRTWQGRRIQLEMDLPRSMTAGHGRVVAVVTTGPLFLDYADVLLPHGPVWTSGQPSRSECTSATAHVSVPGLHLLPNYVSNQEERVLLAALTGPHAPWAPPQRTPSGGRIQRRVQHYGYVFDYATADVLRRDDDSSEEGRERAACPPLPAMAPSRTEVTGLTDGQVERHIARAVADVRGWEALAGVVERTRRVDVAAASGAARDECREKGRTYPHLNQLTVNEYAPGQGIGSHVDTETAFDDGLLIVTLGGGIVMEFRKVDDATGAKKLLYLPPRSLVLLSGDARYQWEHMIVSRRTDTVDGEVLPRKLRVSLTLRTALTAPRPGQNARPLPLYESSAFPPRWGQPSEAAARNAASSMDQPKADLVTPECEARHVHDVYDAIATQWHHTRGKRGVLWPGATRFLETLPPGSVVADVGCGDGKYFAAIWASRSYVIGTDISEPLLQTARAAGDDGAAANGADGPQYQRLSERKRALGARPAVAVADCIHLPLRTDSCDAAICIAVMHHLSTVGRRLRCLAELRRVVKAGGLVNVQAWALEQEDDSKRKFHGTDLLVPFNTQPKYLQSGSDGTSRSDRPTEDPKGKGVAQMMAERYEGAEYDSKKNLVVFQRYCHMYRRGELESLCEQVPGLEVLESSYEKGNHGVLLRVCN